MELRISVSDCYSDLICPDVMQQVAFAAERILRDARMGKASRKTAQTARLSGNAFSVPGSDTNPGQVRIAKDALGRVITV